MDCWPWTQFLFKASLSLLAAWFYWSFPSVWWPAAVLWITAEEEAVKSWCPPENIQSYFVLWWQAATTKYAYGWIWIMYHGDDQKSHTLDSVMVTAINKNSLCSCEAPLLTALLPSFTKLKGDRSKDSYTNTLKWLYVGNFSWQGRDKDITDLNKAYMLEMCLFWWG